jgi:hypothetical protein
MTRRLAELLLSLAARAAPPDRRPWIEALRAECQAIPQDEAALRWASGGLLAALGWALRREAAFVISFSIALCLHPWVAGYGFEAAQSLGLTFFAAAESSRIVFVALFAFGFAAWRPERAWLAGFGAPMLSWLWVLDGILLRSAGQPIPWGFYLGCIFSFGWPAALGAIAGALIGRRRLRTA